MYKIAVSNHQRAAGFFEVFFTPEFQFFQIKNLITPRLKSSGGSGY